MIAFSEEEESTFMVGRLEPSAFPSEWNSFLTESLADQRALCYKGLKRFYKFVQDGKVHEKVTPLMLAAGLNNLDAVKFLLPYIEYDLDDLANAFAQAVRERHFNIADYLFDQPRFQKYILTHGSCIFLFYGVIKAGHVLLVEKMLTYLIVQSQLYPHYILRLALDRDQLPSFKCLLRSEVVQTYFSRATSNNKKALIDVLTAGDRSFVESLLEFPVIRQRIIADQEVFTGVLGSQRDDVFECLVQMEALERGDNSMDAINDLRAIRKSGGIYRLPPGFTPLFESEIETVESDSIGPLMGLAPFFESETDLMESESIYRSRRLTTLSEEYESETDSIGGFDALLPDDLLVCGIELPIEHTDLSRFPELSNFFNTKDDKIREDRYLRLKECYVCWSNGKHQLFTPLMFAAARGDVSAVVFLCDHIIPGTNEMFFAAIHAVRTGHLEVFNILAIGQDVQNTIGNYQIAFYFAAKYGQFKMLQRLLEFETLRNTLKTTSSFGLLMKAVHLDALAVLKLLLNQPELYQFVMEHHSKFLERAKQGAVFEHLSNMKNLKEPLTSNSSSEGGERCSYESPSELVATGAPPVMRSYSFWFRKRNQSTSSSVTPFLEQHHVNEADLTLISVANHPKKLC